MKKILVTGAAGLLGQYLVYNLFKDYAVLGIDAAPNPFKLKHNFNYVKHNLINKDKTLTLINEFQPNAVFNCAAFTDVDACEQYRALASQLNTEIVEILNESNVKKIIHYSTDYIFGNQNSGPYSELDAPGPLNFYGQTKLESEEIIKKSNKPYCIIRTNGLFGKGAKTRSNFVSWVKQTLDAKKEILVPYDQFYNPIHAGNLAEASIELMKTSYNGIINVAGRSYISKYEAAIVIADHFNLIDELVIPVTTEQLNQKAKRPLNGGLKIDLAHSFLQTKLENFPTSLKTRQI